jgi:His/Glu/Gln/Arg/opine family amino acid ABC transporter permease subunit
MEYTFRFDVVWSNFGLLIIGLKYTIMLSLSTMALGTLIGVISALIRMRRIKVLSPLVIAYVEFFRGTPALVQIVWIYYCLPIVLGINIPGAASLVLAMALNSGAYLSEVFRAGIQAVDKGHIEAAWSLGFTRLQATRRVVLPQAMYRMLPAMGNVFIGSIKMSSLCSVLGMTELMYQGNVLTQNYFRPLEVLTVVALLYFCLTYATSMFLIFLEYKFAWVKREKFIFRQQVRLLWARLSPER